MFLQFINNNKNENHSIETNYLICKHGNIKNIEVENDTLINNLNVKNIIPKNGKTITFRGTVSVNGEMTN